MSSGTINLPSGLKESGRRVDFRPDEFILMIETKGYRVAWSRSALCPCAKISDQIQVDPDCSLCEGSGWFYFAPTEATINEDVTGELSEIQKTILTTNKAGVIRAIMSNFVRKDQPYDKIGRWSEGDTVASVRWENRLGYYDKLVNFDAETIYAQILDIEAGTTSIKLKYPAIEVNLVRAFDKEYVLGEDFTVENGEIVWLPNRSPTEATRLSVHYLIHPTYLVIEHPHVMRSTLLAFKTAVRQTPMGDPKRLPLQAKVMYEHLV